MSISSEISRISGNIADALSAIANKGVTVPSGSNSDDLATLIGQISGGGGISITEEANATGTTLIVTSGGVTPTQEEHEIYFEFSDSTNTTITGYWDDDFISDAITATTPTTYDSKTVTLAQLDGTTWYEVGGGIPLNTELIDFNSISVGYEVGSNGQLEPYQYYSASDYTPVEYGMTFTYRGAQWSNLAFYDSSKAFISSFDINSDGSSVGNNTCTGTLSGNKIPQNAAYVRIPASTTSPTSTYLSLIRTA